MLLPQFRRDILYYIFSHIDFDSIANLRLTCKRLHDLITLPWIESNYTTYFGVTNTYKECPVLPNGQQHGLNVQYAEVYDPKTKSNHLRVTTMQLYRFGRLDGPCWYFHNSWEPWHRASYIMYRKDLIHGICAQWTKKYGPLGSGLSQRSPQDAPACAGPLGSGMSQRSQRTIILEALDESHDELTREYYFWGRQIPEGKSYNPDTDIYAYKSHSESWVALSNGGIIIQRIGYGNANEYRISTFNVDTKVTVIEYYDRRGNMTVCIEYDPKHERAAYRSWHKNGTLKQTGQYRGGSVNNRRCGVWLRYAVNGTLIGSTLYLDKEKVMWHRDTW